MRPVITSVLKNGFRVYSQYDYSDSANVCGVCVRVGSTSDPPPFCGLAHLIEHNIYNGAKAHPREETLLMNYRLGDFLDFKTGRMCTHFSTNNLPHRRHLGDAFCLVAGLIKNFKIDLGGLKTEKAAVHQEFFEYGLDYLSNEVIDILYENIYAKNPIRNRITGLPSSIKPIPPSRITNFYNKYYTASNMAAIIIGPKHNEAVEMAKEFFESMPATKASDRFRGYLLDEHAPVFDTAKTIVQERPGIHQAHLAIGFPVSLLKNDIIAFELMAHYLGFRLGVRLREENQDFDKGAYGVSVNFENSAIHSVFVIRTAISLSHVERAAEMVIEEFQKLKTERISPLLFSASVERLLNLYGDAFNQSSSLLAEKIADAFANDDEELKSLHSYPEDLRRLTSKKIMTLANEHINSQSSVRAIIKPA